MGAWAKEIVAREVRVAVQRALVSVFIPFLLGSSVFCLLPY
jgi:hypothetical protein